MTDILEENKLKGDDFEKWVVRKFNPDFFEITEWRSDKSVDGIYPTSSRFPDLEISLKLHRKEKLYKYRFAIECKWRSNYFKNGLEWAKPYQIMNYKRFALQSNLPVFVILGVQGDPLNPEFLHVIPLNEISTHFLNRPFLNKYLAAPSFREFFYDHTLQALRPAFIS